MAHQSYVLSNWQRFSLLQSPSGAVKRELRALTRFAHRMRPSRFTSLVSRGQVQRRRPQPASCGR
jgi:hypothetical protein